MPRCSHILQLSPLLLPSSHGTLLTRLGTSAWCFSNSIPGSSLSQNVMLWRCVLYMNAYQNMCVDIMNQQPNMDPSPRTNDVLTPGACQALLTYTFILWDSPIRLQLLFLILHCLRHQSIQSIGHYNSDLTLGMSREFTFNRVSADILLALYSPTYAKG